MKIKILICSLLLLLTTKNFAQQTDSASIFRPKILKGYFVCKRDTIPKTDSDVTLSRYDFTIFFFPNLTDSLIQSLDKIKLSTPGYTLISGGTNYAIGDPKLHKQYINYLITNNLFSKADRYGVFDYNKIDHVLIESNKSFVSLYKGNLTVVGPFLPNIHLIDLSKQDLYMYLPNDTNTIEYICTILY